MEIDKKDQRRWKQIINKKLIVHNENRYYTKNKKYEKNP